MAPNVSNAFSISASPDRVEKLRSIIGGVDVAVQAVIGILGEAGVGNHLNEEQIARAEHLFATMAQVALKAFHDAHDVPITPESILALLSSEEDVIEAPAPEPAPVVPAAAPAPEPEPVAPTPEPVPQDEQPKTDAPAADAPETDVTQ
jgi:fructose-specific phosphotransferase system component IIB